MDVGRLIARGLNAHGIHTFLIHLPWYGRRAPETGKPTMEMILPALSQGIADVRRARDAVAALPVVDAGRIAVQGTSLGGFVTATAAGLDRGFDRTFILLAGGDLAGIVKNGRKDAAKFREELTAAGMTDEKIAEVLGGDRTVAGGPSPGPQPHLALFGPLRRGGAAAAFPAAGRGRGPARRPPPSPARQPLLRHDLPAGGAGPDQGPHRRGVNGLPARR